MKDALIELDGVGVSFAGQTVLSQTMVLVK